MIFAKPVSMRRRASARPSWCGMLTVIGVAMRPRLPRSAAQCKRLANEASCGRPVPQALIQVLADDIRIGMAEISLPSASEACAVTAGVR
jgi:hypothetical protein